MEVLSSCFLLRPRDLECSLRFYDEPLGLAVYRQWGALRLTILPSRGPIELTKTACIVARLMAAFDYRYSASASSGW